MSNKALFEQLLARENHLAKVFRSKTYDKYRISAADKTELLEQIDCQLSPENLTCDGELSASQVREKSNLLRGAQAYLETL